METDSENEKTNSNDDKFSSFQALDVIGSRTVERTINREVSFQEKLVAQVADPELTELCVQKSKLNLLAAPFIPGMQAGECTQTMTDWEYTEDGEYEPKTEFEILFQYDPDHAVEIENSLQGLKGDSHHDILKMKTQLEEMKEVGCGDASNLYDIKLAELVIQSRKYNYEGLRIPLKTRWNTDLLAEMLQGCPDEEVLQFIKFGWPIDRDNDLEVPDAEGRNHRGATEFPDAVDKHIQEEIAFGAVVGGFNDRPMGKHGFATSPVYKYTAEAVIPE